MRLAINAIPIAPGGGLTVLLGLLEGWREAAVPLDIRMYASRPEVLNAVAERFPDIALEPVAVNLRPPLRYCWQQARLGRLLGQWNVDVVYTVNFAIRNCPAPQLVHHQNLWRFLTPNLIQSLRYGPTRFIRDWEARKALKKAAANVFISDYLRLQAERLVPESASRNHTIHNGLPTRVIEASRQQGSHWNGEPCLTAITTDAPHKDNPTLVRILAELVRHRPDVAWRLRVAGAGNFTREKALAEDLGIGERIEWLGFVDSEKLNLLLRSSLCMVFTSVLEGFGLPLIEAMARSCPVVACNCTAIPEVTGDAGILVEPSNAGQFAEAVLRLYEDHHFRNELIQKGLNRISSFSWVESARKMAKIMERIAH